MGYEKAENRIKEYRAIAGAFAPARRVIEEFDGKIYNCRLDKALKEAFQGIGSIYAKKDGNRIYIEFSPAGHGYGWRNIVNIAIQDALPDGKRIDADAMIENARELRAENLRRAYELEEMGKHVDEIKKQLASLAEQVKAVLKPIGYEARDLYGIEFDRYCGR